jgi:hypothetical protein
MGLVSSLLWQTETKRGLIRLNEGATTAGVLVGDCNAAELRELSKAALEAAEQLDGFAADAAEVRKPR